MLPLRVAVCTNRPAAAMLSCRDALVAQVPTQSMILVTSGLEPEAVVAHRASFPGTVLVEPRRGLSLARNRALAACGDGELLAFVDDDAVVAEGWREALERHWARAGSRIACIGGPIRPRYQAPPPAWLSEDLLQVLTVLDLGPRPRDLDPEVAAVFGANISFRADALRRVGGFDAAFGHRGGRTGFSEEDEAQRALARLGHGVRYVPDAAVWHLIPPERLTRGSFLRRRLAYGHTLSARRGRPPALALRQAVRSALGSVTAAARGRDALAMERAVRAAENIGVLTGPWIARP